MKNFQYTELTEDRVDEVRQLYFSMSGRNMDGGQLTSEAIESFPTVVVLDNDRVVGFVLSLKFAPDIVEISNIFIHPDYRNMSVGSKAQKLYEDKAKDNGWKGIIAVNSALYEGKKDTRPAESFYLKNGYQCIAKTDGTFVFYKEL